jgi:hypothetical protein
VKEILKSKVAPYLISLVLVFFCSSSSSCVCLFSFSFSLLFLFFFLSFLSRFSFRFIFLHGMTWFPCHVMPCHVMSCQYLNSLLKSIASALEIVGTAIVSYLVFGSDFGINTVCSVLLVGAGVYLYSTAPVSTDAEGRGKQAEAETNDDEVAQVLLGGKTRKSATSASSEELGGMTAEE